jgi:hypothetical protein
MKYCYACGHTTGGEPRFCNFCGRSYDVKLCPKLHVNTRLAQACSQCGSQDLSIPQPKVPLLWRLFAVFAQVVSGLILLCLSAPVVLALGIALLTGSQIRAPLTFAAMFLAASWFLWTAFPAWFRRIFHRALIRGNGKR